MEDATFSSNQSTNEESETSSRQLAALEALLFAYGAPLDVERLAKIMNVSQTTMRTMLGDLQKQLLTAERGLRLLEDGTSWQLGTAPEASSLVERLFKEDFKEELTQASLETLAIITYRGPISRSEVDYIRGVNSSYILRTLLIRGLVNREADPSRPQVFLYRPSLDLLKLLGVTSAKELPDFDLLSQKLQVLEVASEGRASPPVDSGHKKEEFINPL